LEPRRALLPPLLMLLPAVLPLPVHSCLMLGLLQQVQKMVVSCHSSNTSPEQYQPPC